LVVPPALVVTLVSAVVLPTAPENVVAPVLLTVNACAPLIVLLKETLPLPAFIATAPVVSVTGPLTVTFWFAVVTPLPANVMPLGAVSVTLALLVPVISPFATMVPPAPPWRI